VPSRRRRLITAKVWVLSRTGPRGISGGSSSKGTGFSPNISVFSSVRQSHIHLILLLPEGQAGENYKTSNIAMFLQTGNIEYRRSLEGKLCSDGQSSENQITLRSVRFAICQILSSSGFLCVRETSAKFNFENTDT
jgi:hypothetical protein